mgnify:CR=1 FL=1
MVLLKSPVPFLRNGSYQSCSFAPFSSQKARQWQEADAMLEQNEVPQPGRFFSVTQERALIDASMLWHFGLGAISEDVRLC